MLSALATTLPAHPAWHGGWGPGPWILLVPLFWIAVIVALVAFGTARRRRWAAAGYGPCGPAAGPWGGGRSTATSVLAERFARGEIDEAEYRARLETLLATEPRRQP